MLLLSHYYFTNYCHLSELVQTELSLPSLLTRMYDCLSLLHYFEWTFSNREADTSMNDGGSRELRPLYYSRLWTLDSGLVSRAITLQSKIVCYSRREI